MPSRRRSILKSRNSLDPTTTIDVEPNEYGITQDLQDTTGVQRNKRVSFSAKTQIQEIDCNTPENSGNDGINNTTNETVHQLQDMSISRVDLNTTSFHVLSEEDEEKDAENADEILNPGYAPLDLSTAMQIIKLTAPSPATRRRRSSIVEIFGHNNTNTSPTDMDLDSSFPGEVEELSKEQEEKILNKMRRSNVSQDTTYFTNKPDAMDEDSFNKTQSSKETENESILSTSIQKVEEKQLVVPKTAKDNGSEEEETKEFNTNSNETKLAQKDMSICQQTILLPSISLNTTTDNDDDRSLMPPPPTPTTINNVTQYQSQDMDLSKTLINSPKSSVSSPVIVSQEPIQVQPKITVRLNERISVPKNPVAINSTDAARLGKRKKFQWTGPLSPTSQTASPYRAGNLSKTPRKNKYHGNIHHRQVQQIISNEMSVQTSPSFFVVTTNEQQVSKTESVKQVAEVSPSFIAKKVQEIQLQHQSTSPIVWPSQTPPPPITTRSVELQTSFIEESSPCIEQQPFEKTTTRIVNDKNETWTAGSQDPSPDNTELQVEQQNEVGRIISISPEPEDFKTPLPASTTRKDKEDESVEEFEELELHIRSKNELSEHSQTEEEVREVGREDKNESLLEASSQEMDIEAESDNEEDEQLEQEEEQQQHSFNNNTSVNTTMSNNSLAHQNQTFILERDAGVMTGPLQMSNFNNIGYSPNTSLSMCKIVPVANSSTNLTFHKDVNNIELGIGGTTFVIEEENISRGIEDESFAQLDTSHTSTQSMNLKTENVEEEENKEEPIPINISKQFNISQPLGKSILNATPKNKKKDKVPVEEEVNADNLDDLLKQLKVKSIRGIKRVKLLRSIHKIAQKISDEDFESFQEVNKNQEHISENFLESLRNMRHVNYITSIPREEFVSRGILPVV